MAFEIIVIGIVASLGLGFIIWAIVVSHKGGFENKDKRKPKWWQKGR